MFTDSARILPTLQGNQACAFSWFKSGHILTLSVSTALQQDPEKLMVLFAGICCWTAVLGSYQHCGYGLLHKPYSHSLVCTFIFLETKTSTIPYLSSDTNFI